MEKKVGEGAFKVDMAEMDKKLVYDKKLVWAHRRHLLWDTFGAPIAHTLAAFSLLFFLYIAPIVCVFSGLYRTALWLFNPAAGDSFGRVLLGLLALIPTIFIAAVGTEAYTNFLDEVGKRIQRVYVEWNSSGTDLRKRLDKHLQ